MSVLKAIHKLKPDAEFTIFDEDYSTIIWQKLDGEAPTKAEIDAAIIQVKKDEEKAQAEAQAKKLAAEAKLLALGLTLEDLKALGLG